MSIPKVLVAGGLLLVAAGWLWPLLARVSLGRPPGDMVIEREGFRPDIPITSLLIGAVLSAIVWLLNR
jgi:hypothetical protein